MTYGEPLRDKLSLLVAAGALARDEVIVLDGAARGASWCLMHCGAKGVVCEEVADTVQRLSWAHQNAHLWVLFDVVVLPLSESTRMRHGGARCTSCGLMLVSHPPLEGPVLTTQEKAP